MLRLDPADDAHRILMAEVARQALCERDLRPPEVDAIDAMVAHHASMMHTGALAMALEFDHVTVRFAGDPSPMHVPLAPLLGAEARAVRA